MNTKKFLLFTAWIFVIASISVNCSLMNNLIADHSYLTPVSQADLDAYQPGASVETAFQAVLCARCILRTNRISWLEAPKTIFVDRISYQEAIDFIKQSEPSIQNVFMAEDERVWLVMFKGKMTVTPSKCRESVPATGCVYAILDAREGAEINSGSLACDALDLSP